jgi:hypothetical protein
VKTKLLVLGLLGSLVLPAAAHGDVLVSAVPSRLVCGDAIRLGIWAQPGTTSNRRVRMTAIDRRTGRVWWRKTAMASTRRWHYWTLPSGRQGQCGPTTIVYRGYRADGSTWVSRDNVQFRGEGV